MNRTIKSWTIGGMVTLAIAVFAIIAVPTKAADLSNDPSETGSVVGGSMTGSGRISSASPSIAAAPQSYSASIPVNRGQDLSGSYSGNTGQSQVSGSTGVITTGVQDGDVSSNVTDRSNVATLDANLGTTGSVIGRGYGLADEAAVAGIYGRGNIVNRYAAGIGNPYVNRYYSYNSLYDPVSAAAVYATAYAAAVSPYYNNYYGYGYNNYLGYHRADISVVADPVYSGGIINPYGVGYGYGAAVVPARNLVLQSALTGVETVIDGNCGSGYGIGDGIVGNAIYGAGYGYGYGAGIFRPAIQAVKAIVSDYVFAAINSITRCNPFADIVLNPIAGTISFRDWYGYWVTREAIIYT